MNILSLQDFMSHFNISKSITFDEFKKLAKTYRGLLIEDWLDSFPTTDVRKQKKDEILERLYQIMVIDRVNNLILWYNEHISLINLTNYTHFQLDKDIISGNTIKGKLNNLTRINKNLFFDQIYDTQKIGFNTKPTLFLTLKAFFEDYCLFRCASLPMGIRSVLNNNISALYAILRGTENKASTFNPYTIAYIIENIYKADKLFTPVLDWCSYLIGFYNTTANEYVGNDVIPKTITVANDLVNYYNNANKKTQFYCCPSEKLEERENFANKYKNYFDSIFLDPPYFELEKYNDGEQSINSFPDYNDWLNGYWRETMKLCSKVITKNGHFGFVASNYKNKKNKWINVADDLFKISSEYFDLEQHYLIGWNSFKVLDSEKMKKGNFEDFYFMKAK